MVDVWLPYGKTEVHARVASENLVGVMAAREGQGAKDIAQKISNTLKETPFPENLRKTIRLDGKVVLALNVVDATLAKLVVSSVITWVRENCAKNCNLTVLLANNPFTYRAPTIAEHLREELLPLGVNLVVHDPIINNLYICDKQGGVKIYLDKMFYEADVKIMVSAVEPNPYTLYDCCECGVSFGLTSIETIKNILAPILDADNVQEKLFNEAIEISKSANVDFSIGIVRNMRGEVTDCFAGNPEEVLRKSVDLANSLYKIVIEGRADIVIISPGGAPFDDNILSACRCLENAIKVIRERGVIILVAECSEGYGELYLHQIIRKVKGDLNQLRWLLEREFSINNLIFYRFIKVLKRNSVFMVSAIPDYYISGIPGLKVFRTLNDALNYALDNLGTKAKIAVIPHGNHIVLAGKE